MYITTYLIDDGGSFMCMLFKKYDFIFVFSKHVIKSDVAQKRPVHIISAQTLT